MPVVEFKIGDKDYTEKLNTMSAQAGDVQQAKTDAEQAVIDAQAKVTLAANQVTLATTQKNEAVQAKLDAEAAAVAANNTVAGSHTHTAAEVGALPNTGGVVYGLINARGGLYANNNGTSEGTEFRAVCDDNYARLEAYKKGDNTTQRGFVFSGFNGADLTAFKVKFGGAERNIFHEGFLPTPAQIGADDTGHMFKADAGAISVDVSTAKHIAVQVHYVGNVTINLSGAPKKGGTLTVSRTRESVGEITISGVSMWALNGTFATSHTFARAYKVKFRAYSTTAYMMEGRPE